MVTDGESYNVSSDKRTLATPLRAFPNRTFSIACVWNET